MRSERRAAAVALLAVALGGCNPPVDDCVDNEVCGFTEAGAGGSGGAGGVGGSGGSDGGGGIAGASGSGGSAGEGGTCDTTKSPSEEACLVSDAYAVFVDGTAASSGNGTKASPFKTIGEALTAAGTKNVLVCDTTYDEQVKITGGAKVYGGFACADWAYKTGERAVVKPSAKGYALEVGAASSAVVIADIEFTAQAGTAPGESSIAAFVKSSSDVKLMRVKLEAGKGMPGANGTLVNFTFPDALSLKGNNANLLAGGGAMSYPTCPGGGSTTGGKGGNGGTPGDGDPGLPNYGGGAGGKGSGALCDVGKVGNAGPDGPDGTASTTLGTLSSAGWAGGDGGSGSPGLPGQGGGGGGGDNFGGGGSGAAGGCGGAGASGGKAGGSSIALLSMSSTVAISDSDLITTDAGGGGTGVAGQAGMGIGGNGGQGASAGGCQGGKGGPGGAGGASAGGAGGASVAVAYQGTKPDIGVSNVTTGNAGTKGIGGKPGLNDGMPGVKQPLLQVQ